VADLLSLFQGKALLAPLAGITNLPFRLIARAQGCDFCFTEMISANGLIRDSEKTIEYLQSCPEDAPLGIQIFGAEPSVMAEAARFIAERKPEVIDINMGCPVRKVVKSGAGAKLMKDPLLAGKIIEAVVHAVDVPVTVKIRTGWSRGSVNAVEMAKVAQESGAAAVIVHGRTADQGFAGHADWEVIAGVKRSVRIPVIGNGDIRHPQDAMNMRLQTGCDAVMVGRGALGNPWIFRGIQQLREGGASDWIPTVAERYEGVKKHWELEAQYCGERLANRTFRKHLLWYTKGLPGSGRFRELVGKMKDCQSMLDELDKYFASVTRTVDEIMT
jgi:nifR3 family TIM-barrel protein